MSQVFRCKRVSSGIVEGEALIPQDAILFYYTDPATGVVTEDGHCLTGVSVKDTILIFPGGNGSASGQADGMSRLDRAGSAPRALIVEALDTVLVSSAVVMEMPMVYHVEAGFYDRVKNGDWVRVDTEKLTVELVEKD